MNPKNRQLKQLLSSSFFNCIFNSTAYSDQTELINLSVEKLLNIEAISVAIKATSLNDSPATIYVDTNIIVSSFRSILIRPYISTGIRIFLQLTNDIKLSKVGKNLLADNRLEHRQEFITTPTEIYRGMHRQLT